MQFLGLTITTLVQFVRLEYHLNLPNFLCKCYNDKVINCVIFQLSAIIVVESFPHLKITSLVIKSARVVCIHQLMMGIAVP